MVGAGTPLTLQEFLALPTGDVTYEFVNGQVVPTVRQVLKKQNYFNIYHDNIAPNRFN
jgi:hypothetical protein